MGLLNWGLGCLRGYTVVQSIFQRFSSKIHIIRGTMTCDPWKGEFHPNPKTHSIPIILTESFRNIFGLAICLFSIYHAFQLHTQMGVGVSAEIMQEFLLYLISGTSITISLASNHVMYFKDDWHVSYKDLFLLLDEVYEGNAFAWRGLHLDEILIYYLSSGIFLCAPCCCILTLILDSFPFNRLISALCPFLTLPQVRITSCLISTTYTFLALFPTLLVLLDALCYLSAMKCLMPFTYQSDMTKSTVLSEGKFERRRKLYLQLYLISVKANENVNVYVPTLILVTIIISVALWFTVIAMVHVMPLLIYLCFSLFAVVQLFLIFFISFLSIFPLSSSEEFQKCWRRRLAKKVQRLELKACQMVVVEVGPFFTFKHSTFINMLCTILDYVLALLLNFKI
ncbi:unnamed protein product [Orchesella dallaii]|uniref:Odorant receptor n=1 Tax=Orchesella dallaii TaxID=48710 RepID=A0ABP1S9Y6_9HEXA